MKVLSILFVAQMGLIGIVYLSIGLLLTRRVDNPPVNCKILLWRYFCTDLFDRDCTGFCWRTGRRYLFDELRWRLLVLTVQMQDVWSWATLGQRIAVADDVICHRPSLMRCSAIFSRVVP